jgi:hypothetical protein
LYDKCQPIKRFIKFVKAENRITQGLSSVLIDQLQNFNLKERFVVHEYYRILAMSRFLVRFNFPWKKTYGKQTHQLNLVLKM